MEYQKISSRFTCRLCKEQFDLPKALYTHLQQCHNTTSSVNDNRTCPLCGVQCAKYEGYRDHLLYIHGQRTEGQKLTFRSLNDFLLWKTELETKYCCKYILQSAPKILPSNEKKYFYQCDRSESRQGKERKRSSVVKKTCPSMISVVECNGYHQFKVEYWDTHSEHKVHGNPVQKDELAAAISSVEMVQAIDDDQTFGNNENLNLSSEVNGVFSKSSGQESPSKKSYAGNSPAVADLTSKLKNSFSKTDVMKKKAVTNSCLYSLASVACMKGISKKSKDTYSSNIGNKSKEISSAPTTESISSKNVSVQGSGKTEGENLNLDSLNQSKKNQTKKGDITNLKPGTTNAKFDTSHLKPLAPKETPTSISLPSTIINPSVTNNATFGGQVLLLNPVPVGQNSTQNVFPSGQNILLSLNPVGQNVIPAVLPVDKKPLPAVLPVDKKPLPAEKVSSPTDKNTSSPQKKTTVVKNAPEVQNTASVSQISAKTNNVNSVTISTPVSSRTNVSKSPASTVLLSALPVGSTFMNVNNNLIPVRDSTRTFLTSGLSSGIVLAPAVPSPVVTTRIPTSSVSITPKSTISTAGVTSCIPVYPRPPISHSVTSSIAGSNCKGTTLSSSLTITPSKLAAIPASLASKANTLTITKTTMSSSNQSAGKLNTNSAETASSSVVPSLHVDSQKPGTVLFESSGSVYMLEPVDNGSNDASLSANAGHSDSKKTECKKNVEAYSSSKISLPSKRPFADDSDSIVAEKMKFYQLELKYLSCQEECKRMKLDLAKAEKLNQELREKSRAKLRRDEDRKSNDLKGVTPVQLIRELEDNFGDDDADIYIMTRSSVLRNLHLEIEELSGEKNSLHKELEEYRNHDKFYKMLRKKLDEEEF